MVVSFLQHRRPYVYSGSNMCVLLVEFLELYGMTFNYYAVGMWIGGRGRLFNRTQHPHFKSAATGGGGGGSRRRGNESGFRICIQDPNTPSNDVGSGSYRIHMIRKAFMHAFKTLVRTSQFHGSLSILASIIQMDPGMEARRAQVAATFASGPILSLSEAIRVGAEAATDGKNIPKAKVRKSRKGKEKLARQ